MRERAMPIHLKIAVSRTSSGVCVHPHGLHGLSCRPAVAPTLGAALLELEESVLDALGGGGDFDVHFHITP